MDCGIFHYMWRQGGRDELKFEPGYHQLLAYEYDYDQ
jgi:hypothetical protein